MMGNTPQGITLLAWPKWIFLPTNEPAAIDEFGSRLHKLFVEIPGNGKHHDFLTFSCNRRRPYSTAHFCDPVIQMKENPKKTLTSEDLL
jgi:hypothetical protein